MPMKRPMHKFEFFTDVIGEPTEVLMDGEKLRGVTAAHVDWAVNEIPQVTLTFATTSIAIKGLGMNIVAKAEENNQIDGQMSVEDVL